jgi:uncharacterized protein (DUF2235 family)
MDVSTAGGDRSSQAVSPRPLTKPVRKRLVVCCDGTWNTPDERSEGVRAPTNVSKIALGVTGHDGDGIKQLVHYGAGVGTRRFERFTGGAFGYGLSRNVRDGYRFLVEHYEPGDELYFFGFSRGAYTARSLVGFIRNCGILRREHIDRIDEAYELYRSRAERRAPSAIESRRFRRMYAHDDETPVAFIGVWDTVGAVGIPTGGLRPPLVTRYWGFHDTELSPSVGAAYHALAIDEQRGPFTPTLWTRHPAAKEQIVEQVWFAGVHRDVGGGYREPELSEIALLWMVRRAAEHGLAFAPDHFQVAGEPAPARDRWRGRRLDPDPLGPIHDSRKRWYRLLRPRPRELGVSHGQSAASSAVRRLHALAPYHPPSLAQWVRAGRRTTAVPVVPEAGHDAAPRRRGPAPQARALSR